MTMRVVAIAMLTLLALGGCTDSDAGPALTSDAPAGSKSPEATVSPATGPVPVGEKLGQPPTRAELIGTWKPIRLFGEDVRDIRRVNDGRPTITFGEFGIGLQWTAYDGCNWSDGRARLRPSGAFATSNRFTTLRGCLGGYRHIANVQVFTETTRLNLSDGRLRFYDDAGDLLGAYVRTRPGL